MRVTPMISAALMAMVAFAAPAAAEIAASDVDAARVDAMTTQVPAFTWTLAEDRRAAVVFLDDAMTLLDLADERLAGLTPDAATPELMAASGKLTTAYLLLFRDRAGADALRDVATRLGGAAPLATMDVQAARRLIAEVRGQMALAYRSQLAFLGGGAGGGFYLEELEHAEPGPAAPFMEEESPR